MKKLFIAILFFSILSGMPFAFAGSLSDYRKGGQSTASPACTSCWHERDYSISMVPRFQFSCQKGYYKVLGIFSTKWYSVKKDLLTGKTEKTECFYGCDRVSGKCLSGSNFKWKCEGSFFHRNTKSVKINLNTGKIVEEINCVYGCDSASGRCKTIK
ncbi:MAG: hypothetical protein QXK06_05125 [Candidatus Diapherotrites archaeon]